MIRFDRPPINDDELHAAVQAVFGVTIPRKQICPNHVAPFEAFSHAFFAKEPNTALWYGARGSGKSEQLALLGLAKTVFHMGNTTILGGSIHQSNNVYNHMAKMMEHENAPTPLVENFTKTELLFRNKTWVRPLSASQTSVRGPHPLLHLLDEIDEMEWDIYVASLGQAMRQPNSMNIEINEYVVKSSTWQKLEGTFSKVIAEHREKNLPVFSWCWREVIRPHGWMDPDFIERKRRNIPDLLWKIEYELGEPTGETSVFDLQRLAEVFVRVPLYEPMSRMSESDKMWVYEKPANNGIYAMGVDLAKTKDWTVAIVARIDVEPMRVVAVKKVGRISWPAIIDQLKTMKATWNDAEMGHDGTGLGSVVTDLLEGYSRKYLFIGEQRKKLLNEMIAGVETGLYRIPHGNPLYDKFRMTKLEDVWSQTLVNSHLPDESAAMAVLHAVCGRSAAGVQAWGVPKKGDQEPMLYKEMTGGKKSLDEMETIVFDEFMADPTSRSVFVPSL
jgi:terminase large subunit-like protein